MPFQLQITCSLELCKYTGRHYFNTDSGKIYDMPPPVPEIYRSFVKINGDHFKIYTELVTDELSTSVTNFLDKYPEWSDIVEDDDFADHATLWTENDHTCFHEALQWFHYQKIGYTISWFE